MKVLASYIYRNLKDLRKKLRKDKGCYEVVERDIKVMREIQFIAYDRKDLF